MKENVFVSGKKKKTFFFLNFNIDKISFSE